MKETSTLRSPCCSKCRNHNVVSPLKGHKRRCRYKECSCPKCELVEARRDISRRQIALRRLQSEEEEFGGSPDACFPHNNNYGVLPPPPMGYIRGPHVMSPNFHNSPPPMTNYPYQQHRNWYQPYHNYPTPTNTFTTCIPNSRDPPGPPPAREVNQINVRCPTVAVNSQNSSEEEVALTVDKYECPSESEVNWQVTNGNC